MDMSILTVLIAAYNHEDYIRQTLDGVMNQKADFQFKILITDDASTDNTHSIIQEYIDKYPNRIVPIFNSKNIGLNATLKKAISLIDTKYTCMLGGDDYWIDDHKIEKEVDYLEAHPNTSYVHTGFKTWIEESGCFGKNVDHWEWNMPKERDKRLISFMNHEFTYYPCVSTSCFRTDVLMNCYNQFPQLLDYTIGEGILLHSSMCMYGGDFHYFSDLTTVYRVRNNSMSHHSNIEKMLDYKMGYPKRKVITFNLFNIEESKYRHVINKNIDELFAIAYSQKAIYYFNKKIHDSGFDNKIVKKYITISSNRVFTFLYYSHLRNKKILNCLLHKIVRVFK